METVYYIGMVQAWFAALLLWRKKDFGNADKALAVWLVMTGVEMLVSLLNLTVWDWLPDLIIVPFCYGPLLYVYTQLLTGQITRINHTLGWHSLPFFLFILIVALWREPLVIHSTVFLPKDSVTILVGVNNLLFIISIVTYWWMSIRLIKKHDAKLDANLSFESDSLRLKWLRMISWWILGGFILSVITYFVFNILDTYPFNPIYTYHFGLLLFIFSVTYYGIQQPEIQENAMCEISDRHLLLAESNQQNQQANEFGLELEAFMIRHKPYLNGELTIQQLADLLNVSANQISVYLNHYLNKNFFTYINEFRVAEAKARIVDDRYKNYTLVSIGLDSGFNSKSSFNSLFKKITDQTPSEYKKEMCKE